MEQYQYTSGSPEIPVIKQEKYFSRIHAKHRAAYGDFGAANIRDNIVSTFREALLQERNPSISNNVLLVGKVQSGKTSNLELFTALAFDNGFNLVVIYGGYDGTLLGQTTNRFRKTFDIPSETDYSDSSPVIFSSDDSKQLLSVDNEIFEDLLAANKPVFLISMKRPAAMAKVNYLMIQRGLSVHGDVFRMSLKDTAQLYEYWCFIKLVTLMKRNYQLVSSDVIKVDNTGVTISLVKGKKSEVKFYSPRGGMITLSYNPGEQNTQTVNQRPDNVLTLEKHGASIPYKYVFDAKYRIENNPEDPFYPDSRPGPKVGDINTMHRYRDSIVYENDTPSRFMFEKTMFGAYVLFPYDDPDGEYKNHRFYKSIETVNIGGIPFLPGTTELLENFLTELVSDSPESAFERASLPRGIEEKLAKVDWSVRDVMVGTVRTEEQLTFNIEKRGYYAPARFISEDQLPVKYIALHEEDIGDVSGIKRYGEVLTTQKLRRGRIPVTMRKGADPNEQYYYFTVREWIELPETIAIQDSFRGKPQFTNKFLLDHCNKSYQLFAISSEEEYRLMSEINKAFKNLEASTSADNTAVYRINDQHSVIVSDGFFTITTDSGEVLDRIAVSDFSRSPRAGFRRIKNAVD